MCESVGHPVRGLRRVRYAGLDLEGLEPGEWRELTPGEVAALKAAVGL
jgi:23S rRNA pseudouridine2605 synthase